MILGTIKCVGSGITVVIGGKGNLLTLREDSDFCATSLLPLRTRQERASIPPLSLMLTPKP